MVAAWYDRQGPARIWPASIGPPCRTRWRSTSDDFPFQAKQHAARDLTAAAAAGALSARVGAVFPLTEIAAAHDRVDAGSGGRVLVRIPD